MPDKVLSTHQGMKTDPKSSSLVTGIQSFPQRNLQEKLVGWLVQQKDIAGLMCKFLENSY